LEKHHHGRKNCDFRSLVWSPCWWSSIGKA
jgi:hypothetical protein